MIYIIVDTKINKGNVIITGVKSLSKCVAISGETPLKISDGYYRSPNYDYYTLEQASILGFNIWWEGGLLPLEPHTVLLYDSINTPEIM